MAQAGVIYGHKKSKTHPRMKPFIAGNRNEIELLDPEAVFNGLTKAIDFLRGKTKIGGMVLLVGTMPAAKSAILSFANDFKFPYVITRWLGGTLTNFAVLNKRKQYYNDLKVKKESGALAKYTKKEQLEFSNEIGKLSKFFDGLENLTRLPDAIFIVDVKEHATAFREARKMNIPIVAMLDTDDDTDHVNYPIFANDQAKTSIEWILNKIKEGIRSESPNQ